MTESIDIGVNLLQMEICMVPTKLKKTQKAPL